MRFLRSFVVLSLFISMLSGCAGYRLGSVAGKNLQGITSVYIPVPKNQAYVPNLGVLAANAIVRRMDQDGTLTTVQSGDADSQLDVTLVSTNRETLINEQQDVLATNQFLVTITAKVTFTNRKTGKKILDNVEVKGSNSYFVQRDQTENERQAMPMACEDLAKHIVSLVVEGW